MAVDWLENAVIYQIVVDRFSTADPQKDKLLASKTSDDWMGGNLKGVIAHFDHLKNLGINVLYLSPIYKGPHYHGYSVVDPFEMDPRYGTKADLKKLVKLCHDSGIKVIVDFVPNHLSAKSPIFKGAQKGKQSKYRDWFIFKNTADDYLSFLDVKHIPKVNVENKEAREYVISAAKYWVKEFEIDGYRLDHAIGPSLGFWKEFRREIKKINKDFALIGEAGKALGAYLNETFKKELVETLWITRSAPTQVKKRINVLVEKGDLESCIEFNDLMMKELEGVMDACIDFTFRDLVWALADKKIDFKEFWKKLFAHYGQFGKDFLLILHSSNHDCGRFLAEFGKSSVEFSSILQFLIKGPTLIYYGEEIGLKGRGEFEGGRRFMPWDKKSWDKELLGHYQNLCKLRTT